MAMKICWQWWRWYPDREMEQEGSWHNLTDVHYRTIREKDGKDDASGGTLVWVGAIYLEDVFAGAFYTDIEEFHKDVENTTTWRI